MSQTHKKTYFTISEVAGDCLWSKCACSLEPNAL